MDENYLDQLLKAVENQNNTMEEPEDLTSADSSVQESQMEEKLSEDAASIQGVAWSDAEIPVDEISELDKLDELADLDMDNLDFEDIDFDDLDITKMDVNPVPLKKEMENLEFLDIDEKYLDDSDAQAFEEEFKRMKDAEKAEKAGTPDAIYDDQDFVNTLEQETPAESSAPEENSLDDSFLEDNDLENSEELTDIDAMMEEVFGESTGKDKSSLDSTADTSEQDILFDLDGIKDADFELKAGSDADTSSVAEPEEKSTDDDMDDLFAMLGIEENTVAKEASAMPDMENEIPDFEIPPELADVQDINEKKKKKGFMDILFGEEEEDEVLTPEQEEELKKAKEEKKKAKLAKKEAQKGAKAEKKKEAKENKTAKMNAKKAARKAEDERILAEEGPEKKLNKPLVVIIMIFFLAIGGIVIVGSNVFDYTLVITKAKNYFERQKYGLAYREVIGVDVKKKDEELESRIYTVMYVERQYEAYQNYMLMDCPDLALNALLSGLDKYDEYYQDAVELDIVEDLDYAKAEIISALSSTYGLSEEDAKEILALDNTEYTQRIQDMTANISLEAE